MSSVVSEIQSILGVYERDQDSLFSDSSSTNGLQLETLIAWKERLLERVVADFQEKLRTYEIIFSEFSSPPRDVNESISSLIFEDFFIPRGASLLEGIEQRVGPRSNDLLVRTVESIRKSDYSALLDTVGRLRDPSNRQAVLDALEKAFSFSIASTNDPMLSAKFEDMQLTLIRLRQAWNERNKHDSNPELLIGELEDKMRTSVEVLNALQQLGLNTEEIFSNFDMRILRDGKVQYIWRKSGLEKEHRKKS